MGKLKVGVIGSGGIAEKHLEVLDAYSDAEVVALCNRGLPRLQAMAKHFDVPRTFTDYRKMLDEIPVDAVLVLVSVTNTVGVAAECLGRGIPTLLEKPPGLGVSEVTGLLDIANATGCLNMVAFNRRFYSVMQRAKEAISEVGPLVSVLIEAPERLEEVSALGIHPSEVIKRWLFVNGSHCIDLLRFFGRDVAEVQSVSGTWFGSQKDSFGALIRFESGATGHYVSNWMSPGRWSVTLYGKGRRVSMCPLESGVITDTDGSIEEIPVDKVDIQFKPGLYAQDRYFLDCVKNARRVHYPAVDLADAVETMQLVEDIGADQR